jgi:hypothetical protein
MNVGTKLRSVSVRGRRGRLAVVRTMIDKAAAPQVCPLSRAAFSCRA